MKCKLVANCESGNFDKLNISALLTDLGCDATIETINSKSNWNADGFDEVIVCGGDGTLNNAIAKCKGKKMIYIPCGTLNETATISNTIADLATVNDEPFSYVCATGSFTEIGYTAKNSAKRHWKSLAYLPEVFKHFRCHKIAVRINLDGQNFDDCYTLLMVLKSHRCFGFNFNNTYKTLQKNYLVAIKSPGEDSFVNRIKIFFPFFRIFFCGAKPTIKKHWFLLPFDKLSITLPAPRDFCIDGEKRRLEGTLCFCQTKAEPPIEIIFPQTNRYNRVDKKARVFPKCKI